MHQKHKFTIYPTLIKSIFLLLNIHILHAQDVSYIRGGMTLSSGNESTSLFNMAKGTNMPTLSQNLFTEFNLMYSTDFTFDVIDVGLYSSYELPLFNTAFTVAPRIGLNYEKVNMKDLTFDENQKNLKGFFLSYGIGLRYLVMDDTSYYVNVTDTGNFTAISYGTYILF